MDGSRGRSRIFSPKRNGHKDTDEDLLLFREIHKREEERIASLLQPVSQEFELSSYSGNFPLYRIPSAKKVCGYEFVARGLGGVGGNKNDYDWLKTPPATPLFPSLEMKAINVPDPVLLHREIPILQQPLLRFSRKGKGKGKGNSDSEASKEGNRRSLSLNPNPKIPPARSMIPKTKHPEGLIFLNQRAGISVPIPIAGKKISNLLQEQQGHSMTITSNSKSTIQQECKPNFLGANLSRNMGRTDSKMKPISRGVSPLVRTKVPAGFSDETPPNLKTDRSTSASRGRSPNPLLCSPAKPRRQSQSLSHSPSSSNSYSISIAGNRKVKESKRKLTTDQKGTSRPQTPNQAHVPGSRMVDKIMNARNSKSGAEGRGNKAHNCH